MTLKWIPKLGYPFFKSDRLSVVDPSALYNLIPSKGKLKAHTNPPKSFYDKPKPFSKANLYKLPNRNLNLKSPRRIRPKKLISLLKTKSNLIKVRSFLPFKLNLYNLNLLDFKPFLCVNHIILKYLRKSFIKKNSKSSNIFPNRSMSKGSLSPSKGNFLRILSSYPSRESLLKRSKLRTIYLKDTIYSSNTYNFYKPSLKRRRNVSNKIYNAVSNYYSSFSYDRSIGLKVSLKDSLRDRATLIKRRFHPYAIKP